MRTPFAFALLAVRVAGQNGNNGVWFIYPTEGHTYQHMDTVNVTYESPFPTPTLFGWCDGGKTNFYDQRAPGYNASVAVVLNFTSGTPCWFNLRPGRVAGFGANSPAFNLIGVERPSGGVVHGPDTSDPAASSSLVSSAASATAAPTASQVHHEENVSSDGQHETTPAVRADTQQQSDGKFRGDGGGLGGGQSAGIAIGAIIGVLIVAAGLFFWWKKRARKAGQKEQTDQHKGADHKHHCQHHSGQSQWQHQPRTATSWDGSSTYVQSYEHNSAGACVCPAHGQAPTKVPAHGQAPTKIWPVEMSSTNTPSEISTSDPVWVGRPKIELPA
ncbi:hypothetical protein B0T21DRAFT_382141 [Apiosordaria backusii]|uniref:Uncharacterized protein n=1 Tax=Apiosordaria backusii TaxID=314023 RepID=A0AA40K1K7_9PEZI|nr:hypothetical protein B0T21DRAFT_382141 [Apiosordaria backusii]